MNGQQVQVHQPASSKTRQTSSSPCSASPARAPRRATLSCNRSRCCRHRRFPSPGTARTGRASLGVARRIDRSRRPSPPGSASGAVPNPPAPPAVSKPHPYLAARLTARIGTPFQRPSQSPGSAPASSALARRSTPGGRTFSKSDTLSASTLPARVFSASSSVSRPPTRCSSSATLRLYLSRWPITTGRRSALIPGVAEGAHRRAPAAPDGPTAPSAPPPQSRLSSAAPSGVWWRRAPPRASPPPSSTWRCLPVSRTRFRVAFGVGEFVGEPAVTTEAPRRAGRRRLRRWAPLRWAPLRHPLPSVATASRGPRVHQRLQRPHPRLQLRDTRVRGSGLELESQRRDSRLPRSEDPRRPSGNLPEPRRLRRVRRLAAPGGPASSISTTWSRSLSRSRSAAASMSISAAESELAIADSDPPGRFPRNDRPRPPAAKRSRSLATSCASLCAPIAPPPPPHPRRLRLGDERVALARLFRN